MKTLEYGEPREFRAAQCDAIAAIITVLRFFSNISSVH